MKTRLSTYLPLRDVPYALFHAAIWYIALWVVDYPVYETLGVIVLAYITSWTSRLIVSSVIESLLDRALRKFDRVIHKASHVADNLGIEITDEPPSEVRVGSRITAGAVFLSIVWVIGGASLVLLIPAMAMVELTPLGIGFSIAAFTLLIGGLLVIVPFFALTFARLARAETLSNTLSTNKISEGVSHIRRSQRLLTQWKLAA